jgi:orotate phosphoribosyltransferase
MITYPITIYINRNNTILDIELMIKNIKKYIDTTETNEITLIGTGSSGAILCGIIAWELNKEKKYKTRISYIKKDNEKAHYPHGSKSDINVEKKERKLIFIDDFISTGQTLLNVLVELEKINKKLDAICTSDNNIPKTMEQILEEQNIKNISI